MKTLPPTSTTDKLYTYGLVLTLYASISLIFGLVFLVIDSTRHESIFFLANASAASLLGALIVHRAETEEELYEVHE